MEKVELNEDEKQILKFLEGNSDSYMNLKDISKSLNLSYPTILKRVEILERFGYIKIIEVGNNKICTIKDGKKKF